MKCRTAAPARARWRRNETPWVDRAVFRTPEIFRTVPAEWQPVELYPAHAEHGLGAYGAVLPTYDPRVVLKLTTDESEAGLAAYLVGLRAQGVTFAGLVGFYQVEPLGVQEHVLPPGYTPGQTPQAEVWPMWAMWREAVRPLTEHDNFEVLQALSDFQHGTHHLIWPWRQWFEQYAQQGYSAPEHAQHLRAAWQHRDPDLTLSDDYERWHTQARQLGLAPVVARLVVLYDELVQDHLEPVPELRLLARSLLDLLRYGVLICDAHWGNAGWAERDSGETPLVLSDVGQAVALVPLSAPDRPSPPARRGPGQTARRTPSFRPNASYPAPEPETFYTGASAGTRCLYRRNPIQARRARKQQIDLPLGRYEDLRVRVGLVREPDAGKFPDMVIGQSADIFKLMRTYSAEPVEIISAVLLDTKYRVLGIHEAARGSVSRAVVEPKSILQAAVIANASAVVLVHNHPSGSPEPSPDDEVLTEDMQRACDLLGFKLLDHVVVGTDSYVSFADRGLM